MRKILALVLAMCMALAAVSALADEDFTGVWYLTQYGLGAASLDLKADGTCAATVESADPPTQVEGTWSADGNNVTITYDGQSMAFAFDGTDLVLSAEAMAEMSGTSIPEGTDLSMFSSLMKLSREPADLSAAEYAAYTNDGTIPEGKTKEDMEAIDAEMKTLMMSLFSVAAAAGTAAEGTEAQEEAAPVLSTVEENFYIRETYFGREAVYIAKVQNTTEDIVSIGDGLLVLKDENGEEISRREWYGTVGSRYLEPGEVTVVSFVSDEIEEGKTVSDYEVTIGANRNGYATPDVAFETSNVELREREFFSNKEYLTAATLTNTGDEPVANLAVVFILRDSEGKMIAVGEWSLGRLELCPGSSVNVVDSVDSSAVEYCTANGLALGELEAIAWQEIRDY